MNGGSRSQGPVRPARVLRRAFPLIELLVVISIVALLMALLLPVLHKARKQAQTVARQANLHQWALLFQLYTSEHEGRWFRPDGDASNYWWRLLEPYYDTRGYYKLRGQSPEGIHGILRCPAKTWYDAHGYHLMPVNYHPNDWMYDSTMPSDTDVAELYLRRADASRSPGTVPVLLDSYIGGGVWALFDTGTPPPPVEGVMYGNWFCTPRHGGFVNGVFLDWSVRKVGLKELWTLKWPRRYDTAGPWTKAGGATPGDWPPWMRRFKEY